MKRFLSSIIASAYLISNSIFVIPAFAAPVAPTISDWLVPATSADGNITIEWNMYWGENGNRWYVNEDGNNIHEETLTPNGNQAQSGSVNLTNRPGGSHRYQVFLCQDSECTGSNTVSTVIEKDGFVDASVSPAVPVIAWMPSENSTGNYEITWNMWWGENGNTWKLEENGQQIHQADIVMNSPQAQEASFNVSGKSNGNYSYVIVLCKKTQDRSENCSRSSEKAITVKTTGSDDPASTSNTQENTTNTNNTTETNTSSNTENNSTNTENNSEPSTEPESVMPEQAEPIFFEQPLSTPIPSNDKCTTGWKITGYFTPLAADYTGIAQTVSADGQQITAPSDFLTTIRLEGWGKLSDGRYIGYYDNAYHLSNIALDSQGNELHLNSAAVDTSVLSYGETFTFPNLPAPYNTRVYEATDIGSTVFGKHIDIFTGEGKQAEQETFKITRDSDELCLEDKGNTPSDPSNPSDPANPPTTSSGKKVVAYFVEWGVYGRGYEVTDIPADKITHLNYAFANIQNGKIVIGDTYAALDRHLPTDSWAEPQEAYYGNFRQLRLLKEANPDLKILISVGGWTWSSQFASISSSASSRQIFSQSVVDFLDQYPFFDGVDIDWEFPVIGGLNPGQASDREGFTVLMQSLRQALGNERLLTIAVNAGPQGISALDYGAFAQYVDDINIMSYDLHGPWDGRTGHNSPLFNNNDPINVQFNVHSAVQNILAQGVPSEKIIIGAAFYGRSFSGVNSTTPLYAPSTGAGPGSFENGILDYKDIASNYLTNPNYERYWDATAKVPYLYSQTDNVFVSYDDPESISNKAQYVVENNLGGVMFWELTSDNGDLVNAIHQGYNSSSTSSTTNNLIFTDLPTSHPLTQTVTTAVTEGWIQGYEDNTVGLEIPLNRAEFISMAMKAFDVAILPFDENFANMFSDNPADAWFSANLYTAAKYELISGYEDGTVRPNETIILAEALRVILELKGGKDYSGSDPWFQSYWDEALASALVTDSQIPWDSMTRGDAIELISKVKAL